LVLGRQHAKLAIQTVRRRVQSERLARVVQLLANPLNLLQLSTGAVESGAGGDEDQVIAIAERNQRLLIAGQRVPGLMLIGAGSHVGGPKADTNLEPCAASDSERCNQHNDDNKYDQTSNHEEPMQCDQEF
jgi:hypothetical protein